jgi:hypothetical protein
MVDEKILLNMGFLRRTLDQVHCWCDWKRVWVFLCDYLCKIEESRKRAVSIGAWPPCEWCKWELLFGTFIRMRFRRKRKNTSIWPASSHPRSLQIDRVRLWAAVNMVKWFTFVFDSVERSVVERSIIGGRTERSESNVWSRYASNVNFWGWWSYRSLTMTVTMANEIAMRIVVESEGVMPRRGDFANSYLLHIPFPWSDAYLFTIPALAARENVWLSALGSFKEDNPRLWIFETGKENWAVRYGRSTRSDRWHDNSVGLSADSTHKNIHINVV